MQYIRKSWLNFQSMSDQYLNKLNKHKKLFYPFSEKILQHSAEFPSLKNNDFRKFINDITGYRKNCAKENFYRRTISPDEAEEIYYYTKVRFQNLPSRARIFFYEAALAEETMKEFLLGVCCAKQKKVTSYSNEWRLSSASDDDFSYEIPIVRAGNRKYSIHMYSSFKKNGWGIRKDHIEKLLLSETDDFQGALFCSMKQHSDGSAIVCFENYLERNRVKQLLNQEKELFDNFTRLNFKDVYYKDSRDNFLETASNAVMEIKENFSYEILKTVHENVFQFFSSLSTHKTRNAIAAACIVLVFAIYGLFFRITSENDISVSFRVIGDALETPRSETEKEFILQSGDYYKIRFDIDKEAYVYVIFHDSSGQIDKASFGKRKRGTHVVSQGSNAIPFQLDYTTGTETVFLLVSMKKINRFDEKVEELGKSGIGRINKIFPEAIIEPYSYRHE